VAYTKKLSAFPETKSSLLNAGSCSFYDFLHLLKLVADDQKGFDAERIKKAFDSTKNYSGMIGPISFTPQNHCALDAEALVMVTIASARIRSRWGSFASGCERGARRRGVERKRADALRKIVTIDDSVAVAPRILRTDPSSRRHAWND